MSNLDKLQALSFSEFLMLVVSVLTLPVVSVLLKLRGFRKTERIMALCSRLGIQSKSSTARVGQAARMVSIAAVRGPYKARCLEQAITVWWMLGFMGIRSTIRLGIYKSGESVEAHAWVLHEGKIVIGQMNEQKAFTPLLDVNIERQQ
ncbi:MAG: lasso peptide biosynthesis B2 protein [Gammaproteobacteria bacterium]|nr:lasso peptide biosynthesis B2 protein [Gammaproteobacteria bacterium]MDG1231117.1 lasso peptide biosynthesis B2 protein [Pseudomonadales bacterium]MBT5155752.1 lasso peptide biosynthesis B2 protein [Gammaproteobacteria bacterium]MBT5685394.1 lasso peptide biosynthesis B2 protein [Gammaproteobacteria bacterium]MBT5722383.1 lasso peptide biosynthesis B2 protein [Gammaproteobacteria bacterium]